MPKITQPQLQSYEVTGKPRDLSDFITMISPEDTPFYTSTGTGDKAIQTMHEWTGDDLNDPGDNAQREGFEVTSYEASNVIELFNRTQIFTKAINVSRTAQGIKQAGVNKQYAHQMGLRMKEAKKDAEYALLGNFIATAGNATTPRRMRGLPAWLTTNANLGAGGAVATPTAPAVAGTARALTKDMIDDIMQTTYEQGGNPKVLMCAPSIRRQVTQLLKTVNVQDEEAKGKRVTDTVRVYDSDFGELKVVPNRVQTHVPYAKDCLFILDMPYWKKSFLSGGNWQEQKLAKTGDNDKGFIVAELTLEARAEQSSGMIADILN